MDKNDEGSLPSRSRPTRRALSAGLLASMYATGSRALTIPQTEKADLTNAVATGYENGPGDVANRFFFPGWRQSFIQTSGMTVAGVDAVGATINAIVGGKGPPLLLLHGNPETHVAWHKVAPTLAQSFTVVATDLRGYGDSSKPEGGRDHINYSKKVMGNDQVEVMKSLGFDRFQVVGHDRGGRVLEQMMLDHPDAVTHGVTLDIAPTDKMYAQTDEAFATKYYWWFFQIQPAPLPEQLIDASVVAYLNGHLDIQCKTPGAITAEAYAEYLRCYRDPATVHGVCEDYRASVSVDRTIRRSENGRKIRQPLLALWGSKGTVGKTFDVLKLWREDADDVRGQAISCGHLMAEEAPKEVLDALEGFLRT